MAESGGSIPPDIGSGKDERKDKAGKYPQGANLPTQNLTLSGSMSTQDPPQQPEGIGIFVKTLTGMKYSLQVAPDEPIKNIKVQIAEKTGIPPDKQVLVLNRHQFEDDDTLFNVTEGSTIHILVRAQKDESSDVAGSDKTCRSDDSAAGPAASVPDRRTKAKNKNVSSTEDRGQPGPASNINTRKQGKYVGDVAKVYEQDSSPTLEQKKLQSNAEKKIKGKSNKNETESDIKRDNQKEVVAGDREDVDRFQQGEGGNRNDMPVKLEVGTKDEEDKCEEQISEEMLAKQSKEQLTDGHQQQTSHTAIGLKKTDKDEFLQGNDFGGSFVFVSKEDADKSEVDSDEGMTDSSVGNSNSSKDPLRSKIESLNEKKKENGKTEKEQSADSKPTTTLKSSFMKNYQGNSKETVVNTAISAAMLEKSSGHEADEKDDDDSGERAEDKKSQTQESDSVTKVDGFQKPVKSAEVEHDTCTKLDDSAGMQIIVTTPNKEEIPLAVKRDDSIAKIKAMIKEERDISIDNWWICYVGVKLEDENKTVADYSIQNRASLIMLVPRNTGKKDQSVDKKASESKIEDTVQPGGMAAEGTMSGTDKDESEEEESPEFQNDFDESIGNPLQFIKGLSPSKIIQEGLDLKLECSISKPDLNAEWSKDGHPLEVTKRIKPVSSGTTHSLEIEDVSMKDTGKYSVKIGDIKSTSTVTVEEKPVTFSLSLQDEVTAEVGKDVLLKCIVSKPDLKPQWTIDNEPVHSSGRIELLSDGMRHTLIIRNVGIEDAGEYCVRFGELQEKTILKVLEWSYKNEGSMVLKSGESMHLEMKFKGNKPKVSCLYNGGEHPDERRTKFEIKDSKVIFSLENVVPSDKGKYILMAENATGNGAVSSVLKVLDTPSAPQNLTVDDVTSGSCHLKWQEPEKIGGSNIVQYIVEISGTNGEDWYNVASCSKAEFTIKGLNKDSKYLVRVAGKNADGIGEFAALSEPVVTKSICDKPSAPKNLTVNDVTSESCHLDWQKPEHENGSRITKYIVQICEGDEKNWKEAGTSTTTDITVYELQRNTQYVFRVAAENEVGTGTFVELQVPVTTEDISKNRQGSHTSDSSSCGPASDDDTAEDEFRSNDQFPSIQPPVDSLVAEVLIQNEGKGKLMGSKGNADSLEMPSEKKVNPDTLKHGQSLAEVKSTVGSLDTPVSKTSKEEEDRYKIEKLNGRFFLFDGSDRKLLAELDNANDVKMEKNVIFADKNVYTLAVDEDGKMLLKEVEIVSKVPLGSNNVLGTESLAKDSVKQRQRPLPTASECMDAVGEQDNAQVCSDGKMSIEQQTFGAEEKRGVIDTGFDETPPFENPKHSVKPNGTDEVEDIIAGIKKSNVQDSSRQIQQKTDESSNPDNGAIPKVPPKQFWQSKSSKNETNSVRAGNPEKNIYSVTVSVNYSMKTNARLFDYGHDLPFELEDIETNMKWRFVLFNIGTFKEKANAYKLACSQELTCEGDRLMINLGRVRSEPDVDAVINSAVQHILNGTVNLTTSSVPLSEDKHELFLSNIRKSSMGQLREIFAFYDKDIKRIYLTYKKSQEKVAEGLVTGILELLTTETRIQKHTFKVSFIFRMLFSRKEFSERIQNTFPELRFRYSVLDEEDKVLITLNGNSNQIEHFQTWLTKEYLQKYGICKVSYNKSMKKNLDEQCQAEVLEEFITQKLKDVDDIEYDINPVARTVWVCSDKAQARADEIGRCIKKYLDKGFMHKESVPYSGILKSKQDAELMIERLNKEHKKYIHVSVTDTNIIVEGVEKYVLGMKAIIEKELMEAKENAATNEMGLGARPKTKSMKYVFEITDRKMYAYLKGSNILPDLERSCRVSAALVTEGNKLLLHVKGQPNDISNFEKKIQNLRENITSEVITLEGEAMSFLDIRLHNISIQSQAKLLLESVDNHANDKGDSKTQGEFLTRALQDAAQMSWDYPEGHRIICTNMYVRWPLEHLLIIPMFESCASEIGVSTFLGETCVFLPVPEKGVPKDKHFISDSLHEALNTVKQQSIHYITVYVEETQSWPKVSHIKPILATLKKWLKEEDLAPTEVLFACVGDPAYKECVGICKEALNNLSYTKHHKYQVKDNDIGGDTEKPVVKVAKGQINKVTADVIVNTTSKELDLKAGAVSASLLESAGTKLQDALKKEKPYGISYGDLVRTEAFNLKGCKHVLHGSLCPYTNGKDFQKLEEFVMKCFMKADELKCTSIAVPAIGTGNLGYPKDGVARAMFHAVQRYLQQRHRYKAHLLTITFVVYEKDTDCIREFLKQEMIWSSRNTAGPISYLMDIGSITEPATETLVYLWEKSKLPYVMFKNHALLKDCGAEVREAFCKHRDGPRKFNIFQTPGGGNISVSEIYHCPCENSLDDIHQAIFDSLAFANNRRKKSTCIAFERNNPFLEHSGQIAEKFVQAVQNFSADTKTLKHVVLMVETDQHLNNLIGPFRKRKLGVLGECRQVQLFGNKEEVVRAKGILQTYYKIVKEDAAICEPVFVVSGSKGVSGSNADVEEPNEQEIDRGHHSILTAPEKLQGSRQFLIPDSRFDSYIQVQSIPVSYTRKALVEALQKLPVRQPKLIFLDKKTSALLLCHSKSDADKLDGYSVLQPLTFQTFRAKCLSKVRKEVDPSFVDKAKENKKFDDFLRELKDADIQVITDMPFVVEAPTTYQLEFVNMTVDKYRISSRKDSEFEGIEKIENVTEIVWDVVRHSREYNTLNGDDKRVSFVDDCIVVDRIIPEDENLQAFKKYIRTVEKMEFFERSTEGYKSEKITEWIGDINETLGYDCCTFVEEKQKVVVVCRKYDDIIKFKHSFAMKSGELKPTGRGRKRNIKDGDEEFSSLPIEQTDVPHSRRVCQASEGFSWKHDAKRLQKYTTSEDIEVYVYEANILKVPVDCIVNAANERLQHGGGIAAVIARAAGWQMKEADEKYLKEHTKLPVGMACKTAAGNLKYSFVVHTVGPEWSYYRPHTYEEVQRCENDLFHAVYNSFLVAESNNAESIAVPAISSAIFHVPEELCVYQYARATVHYSKASVGVANRLKQIHFIDKNSEIVGKIQKVFDCWLGDRMAPQYDTFKFVKRTSKDRENRPDFGSSRRRHGHQNMPFAQGSRQVDVSNSRERDGQQNMSFVQGSSDVDDSCAQVELPIPLSYESGWNSNTFLFCGKETQALLLKEGDLFKIKASAIVVTINERGVPGNIGSQLKSKIIPKEMHSSYTQRVSSELQQKHVGDVLLTDGYSSHYPRVIHAVCSRSSRSSQLDKRKSKIRETYSNIFDLCSRNDSIKSVVMTLIEIDTQNDEEIKMCSEAFLDSYLHYCLEHGLNSSSTFEVYLVCKEGHVADVTRSVFSAYVLRKKAEKDEEIKRKAEIDEQKSQSLSNKSETESPEDSETVNCVICMDSVTDPKTLECGHTFCKDCIEEQFKFKEACPTCGKVIGVITGDQPEGQMHTEYRYYSHCNGYAGYGQIVITYSFPDGKQEDYHPHPGSWYKGITRTAYLPNNDQGREVLAMLKIAFKRKLIFTIGSSRTTGKEGVITWNDIHHKTDPRPHTQFGYPDPKYLDRVTDELSAKGITVKDIEDNRK